MSTTVIWTSDALGDLATVWMAAENRHEVALTVDAIDIQLAADPLGSGESREDRRRVLIDPPLAVAFSASVDGKTVWVHSLWSFTRRRRN